MPQNLNWLRPHIWDTVGLAQGVVPFSLEILCCRKCLVLRGGDESCKNDIWSQTDPLILQKKHVQIDVPSAEENLASSYGNVCSSCFSIHFEESPGVWPLLPLFLVARVGIRECLIWRDFGNFIWDAFGHICSWRAIGFSEISHAVKLLKAWHGTSL